MTPETRPILEHVARYRLTTIDAVHALYFPDRTREAARVCLYRLTEAGELSRFEIRNRSFYRLTPQGCRTLDTCRSLARPFDTQTLVERYGVLVYCTLRTPNRTRLRPQEFRECFPTLAKKGIQPALQHYFLDQDGENLRLGRIVVDGGTPTARLVRKCQDILREALDNALYGFVSQGLYGLTLLTPEESKQQALRAALRRQPLPVTVTVELLPELKQVLF